MITAGLSSLSSAVQQAAPSHDLDNLSESLKTSYEKGDYENVIAVGGQLLAVKEKDPMQKDPQFSSLLLILANSYRATGNIDRAELTYKRAIATLEAIDARGRMLGTVLERYACFLKRDRNKAEAPSVQRRALEILAPLPEGYSRGPIAGRVVPGQRIEVPQPKYPFQAREKHIGGSVSVVVLIDETGKPLTACTESGNEVFAIISEEAAFKARWTPTTLGNVPVRVNGRVIYNFVAE